MPTISFKGKPAVETLHLTIPYRQLTPDPATSHAEKPGLDGNIIVQGDNLLALKALLPAFAGKIKCIYIDPPYNTGNEGWAYNDNVNSPMHQEWLRQTVDREDLTRHDKWLCMIWPRLRLLRELLREDGAIFISIDDNEVHRLRMLMDELFGEQQFIATIIWEKVYSPRMDAEGFSVSHDYIIVYGKSPATKLHRLMFQQNERQFSFFDRIKQKYYRRRSIRKEGKDSLRLDVPSMFFALTAPDGTDVYPIKPDGTEGRWRWSKAKYLDELQSGNVEWVRTDGLWQVYAKQYVDPSASQPPVTLWPHDQVGHNHEAQEELAAIFGPRSFETPKPTRLIRRIVEIATDPEAGDIVLDSFAGSGTTAQAVLALNAADGGNRRFILVEQEQYAESLTAERVRRAITGVRGASDEALRCGYGGSFSFFRLGQAIDEEALLRGDGLPSYRELARYIFFTTTGEQLDESRIDESRWFVGEGRHYEVYMIYQPDVGFLKSTPLSLERASAFGPAGDKPRLVVAPYKLLDADLLHALKIEYCQLPFGIYRFRV
jgi:adenine-specific DNA-methyltransferase